MNFTCSRVAIAFLPDLLFRPLILSRQLREIHVDDLPVVKKELFLSVKSDAVPASLFTDLSKKMAEYLRGT